jgi:hypothetical protein
MTPKFFTQSTLALSLLSCFAGAANAGYIVDFLASGEELQCLGANGPQPCSSLAPGGLFTPLPAGTLLASFYSSDDGNKSTFFFSQSPTELISTVTGSSFDAAFSALSGAFVQTSNPPTAVPGFTSLGIRFEIFSYS